MFLHAVRFFVLLVAFSMFPVLVIHAQDQQAEPSRSFAFKISPQHFFINGFHVDLEKSLRPGSKHALVVSPHIYAGSTNAVDNFTNRYYNTDPGEMIGFGLELAHRIYATTAQQYEGFYMSYGVNYHHFQVDYEGYDWFTYKGENGLDYYVYDQGTFTEKINRIGANTVFGFQHTVFSDRFLIDAYIGGGFKHSKFNSTASNIRYNQGAMDYGFTGTCFLTGFKVGILL